jgi:hypothetical protein
MTGPRRPPLHKNEDDAARDLSGVLLSHPRGAVHTVQIREGAERAERSETPSGPYTVRKNSRSPAVSHAQFYCVLAP